MSIPQQPVSRATIPHAPSKNSKWAISAFIVAIIGCIFGCIPGALIVGWILLPVGFILGIVATVLPGRKTFGIGAIVLSVIGAIISAIVFVSVVAGALNEALDNTPWGSSAPMSASSTEPAPESETEDTFAEAGTRDNPLPLGSTVSSTDWDVAINSVDLAGNEAVAAANQFNEGPAAGTTFIVVNVTATYKGADSSIDGLVTVAYVTATGEVNSSFDTPVVPPEPLFGATELYSGASSNGNIVLQVPDSLDGALRISPGPLADEAFVSIR